jgi:hypothetical protein
MNPLLSKVKLPGRVFQLPSKGLFYGSDVFAPNIKDGEIEVKPMSALTELKLRSPDLLFSGKALEEVCSECCPSILQPNKLVTKDIDALFCFLKISTYGSAMTLSSIHRCPDAKIHQYEVNLETIIGAPNNASLSSRNEMYRVVLSNGQTVKLRPVSFEDSLKLNHLRQEIHQTFERTNQRDPANEDVEKLLLIDLLSVVEGVEADMEGTASPVLITDRKLLEEWARHLQRKWIDELSLQASRADQWGFSMKMKLHCRDCGEEYDHDIEIDPINFFFG